MNLLLDYFKKSQIRQKNPPLLVHPDVEVHKQNRSCGDDCRVKLKFSNEKSSATESGACLSVVSESVASQFGAGAVSHASAETQGPPVDSCKGKNFLKESPCKLSSDLQIEASGCAVHLASSEIAFEVCQSLTKEEALEFAEAVIAGIENRHESHKNQFAQPSDVEEKMSSTIQITLLDPRIAALFQLKDHPVRKKCVLLAWQTLYEALGRPVNGKVGWKG